MIFKKIKFLEAIMYEVYSCYAGETFIDFKFNTREELKRFLDACCICDKSARMFYYHGYALNIYNTEKGYFIGNHI